MISIKVFQEVFGMKILTEFIHKLVLQVQICAQFFMRNKFSFCMVRTVAQRFVNTSLQWRYSSAARL